MGRKVLHHPQKLQAKLIFEAIASIGFLKSYSYRSFVFKKDLLHTKVEAGN